MDEVAKRQAGSEKKKILGMGTILQDMSYHEN